MSDSPTDEADSGGEASEWQPVAERSFERDGDGDLVGAIIETVAAAEETEPMTITAPPLFEIVSISALKELFFGRPDGGDCRACTGQVQFRYREWQVTVTSDGRVIVAEPGRDDDST